MSHIHSPHQCAPISRKIISTITLFCFYVMTLAQSVAATNPENEIPSDLSQNRTSSTILFHHDAVSSADLISTPISQKKTIYSAKSFAGVLCFLAGSLLVSTLVRKASPSNLSSRSLSINSAGDVNGDGKPDMLIGAHSYSSNTGRVYLIYGGSNLANINLASLGSNGITITGAGTSWSNYYDSSFNSTSDVCQWGWNADMFNDAYTGYFVSSAGDDKADMLIGTFPEAQKCSSPPEAPASMKPSEQPKTQPSVMSNQVSVFYQYPLTEQPPKAPASMKPTKQPEAQPSVPPLG
jgi:hypothetical protein